MEYVVAILVNLSFHPSPARARDVVICGSSVNSTRSYSLLPHSKLFPGGIPELLMPELLTISIFIGQCSARVSVFIPAPNKLKVSTGLNVSIPFNNYFLPRPRSKASKKPRSPAISGADPVSAPTEGRVARSSLAVFSSSLIRV